MINEPGEYNLFSLPLVSSLTDSDFSNVILEDGRTVVVFDENLSGLAVANGVSDIFSEYAYDFVKVDLVAFAGATDTQISDTLLNKNWRVIFITADSGDSFPMPSNQFSIVRFSNNNMSTDTQLFLLWNLTRTKGFRNFENWFNKDIRIGPRSVCYISNGKRSDIKTLFTPHPNSPAGKQWISLLKNSPAQFKNFPRLAQAGRQKGKRF